MKSKSNWRPWQSHRESKKCVKPAQLTKSLLKTSSSKHLKTPRPKNQAHLNHKPGVRRVLGDMHARKLRVLIAYCRKIGRPKDAQVVSLGGRLILVVHL